MFGLFRRQKNYDWKKEHSRLWKELVPASGPAETLQGELIRLAGKLTDQAYRNGNANWNETYTRSWNFISDRISADAIFSSKEQKEIRDRIEEIIRDRDRPDLSGDKCPYFFVSEKVVDWCMAHQTLIPCTDFWDTMA